MVIEEIDKSMSSSDDIREKGFYSDMTYTDDEWEKPKEEASNYTHLFKN